MGFVGRRNRSILVAPRPWACCFPGGGCLDLAPIQCFQLGGIPRVNETCLDGTCAESAACCLPDDSCITSRFFECFTQGGSWKQGQDCADDFVCRCWYVAEFCDLDAGGQCVIGDPATLLAVACDIVDPILAVDGIVEFRCNGQCWKVTTQSPKVDELVNEALCEPENFSPMSCDICCDLAPVCPDAELACQLCSSLTVVFSDPVTWTVDGCGPAEINNAFMPPTGCDSSTPLVLWSYGPELFPPISCPAGATCEVSTTTNLRCNGQREWVFTLDIIGSCGVDPYSIQAVFKRPVIQGENFPTSPLTFASVTMTGPVSDFAATAIDVSC